MRTVVTRVKSATVAIGGEVRGEIGQGLLVLLGVAPEDTPAVCAKMADKVLGLRIFRDENDKMNLSLTDVGGSVLVVSQFTLYGSTTHGRRPSFIGAASPEIAIPLYEQFLRECAQRGFPPQHGEFGAEMLVASENDGPVTLILDSEDWNHAN
ncbi:MAG: D-tyrosyl-tRNA(Tyr) deacylase [Oscillospiraceae bacterium]|nr:D-tyrosyl-tRNA(Tyr) deacylase [Oscillospiraceae bacterium]